jgi:hypothetical protein
VLTSLLVCGLAARTQLELVNPYRFADLGHQLYGYELTWRGQIPYRDFWTNWWGPASFYLNALAFALLGPSLLSANLLLALVIAISASALYCISRRIAPRPLAFAIAAVALLWGNLTLNLPYSGWYANGFGVLALLAFARHLESERRGLAWLLATGGLLGLAFSAKQHVGLLSLAAIALAAALAPGVAPAAAPPARDPGPGRARPSPLVARLAALALLALGVLLVPSLVLAERVRSGSWPGARSLLVFVLPVLVVNALGGVAILRGSRSARTAADRRTRLAGILARELALLLGFALAVVPWLVFFSSLLGWSDFPRLLLLLHPLQETFKRAYLTILGHPHLPGTSALFLLALLSLSVSISALFLVASSRRLLAAATIASVLLGLAFLLLALPIGPALGQRLGFPSDFDPRAIAHCEAAELIGPMFYAPLLLGAALLAGLAARGRDPAAALVESRQSLLLFALAAYDAYGLLATQTFVDRAHFQMSVFPWLPVAGFVGLAGYRGLVARMPEPDFAPRRRRAGIGVALALLFGVPWAGKALFVLQLQVQANRHHSERWYPAGDPARALLAEIRHPRARGVLVNRDLAGEIERILEWIESGTREGVTVFGAPSTAFFNFLADREFPSKYSYFLFDPLSEAEKRELLEDLRARAPRLYLLDDFYQEPVHYGVPGAGSTELERFYRDFAQLDEYLWRHYQLEAKIERFRLHRRRAGTP